MNASRPTTRASQPALHRALIEPVRRAMRDFEPDTVRRALRSVCTGDVRVRLGHPLGDLNGIDDAFDAAWGSLFAAWPDLERRDWLVMAGETAQGAHWVGCAGVYAGVFARPWLGVPPTGRPVAMRFHEFFRVEDERVVEMQALWDVPELMLQARAWPMAPSLGREWQVPAPASGDGLIDRPADPGAAEASCRHVASMLEHMVRHPGEGGPEVMQLERFWHPRMSWYGPAGIGTARGIDGFRQHHQIPFLNAMPDRGQMRDGTEFHLFGEGPYAAVTGWPDMRQTLTGDGWLGIAPAGRTVELRSLDFWRLEDGLIRENWVLVDLLDVYRQLGVDVLARMRELTGPLRAEAGA